MAKKKVHLNIILARLKEMVPGNCGHIIRISNNCVSQETTEYIPESCTPSPPTDLKRLSIGSASSLDDEDPESRMDRQEIANFDRS